MTTTCRSRMGTSARRVVCCRARTIASGRWASVWSSDWVDVVSHRRGPQHFRHHLSLLNAISRTSQKSSPQPEQYRGYQSRTSFEESFGLFIVAAVCGYDPSHCWRSLPARRLAAAMALNKIEHFPLELYFHLVPAKCAAKISHRRGLR